MEKNYYVTCMYIIIYSTVMHDDVIMNVGGAIRSGKYPLQATNKMEHFGILPVLLCWTLTGTSGDLITKVYC